MKIQLCRHSTTWMKYHISIFYSLNRKKGSESINEKLHQKKYGNFNNPLIEKRLYEPK